MPPPFSQMFPPSPSFTERELGSLQGKTCLVTGTTSGIGYELAKMIYAAGGTVYMGARSADRNQRAAQSIRAECSSTGDAGEGGRLFPFQLDVSDLGSIRKSAEEVLRSAERLNVIVHNAGIMTPPAGSKSNLGHDLEMATNCLGPFLLTRFLEPLLVRTAASAPKDSARIVWLTSMVAVSVPPDGILWDEQTNQPKVLKTPMENYMESKVGNMFLAHEYAQKLGKDGVLSLAVHPGIVQSGLQRNGSPMPSFLFNLLFKPAKFGAYSELFAAFSPDITVKDNGRFVVPWGRFGPVPEHLQKAMKKKDAGGTGNKDRFVDWCTRETDKFL